MLKNQLRRRNRKEVRAMACKGKGKGGKKGKMMNIIKWLRRFFRKLFIRAKPECEHHYRKHWCRRHGPYGGYVRRCVKCGKEIERYAE